MTFNFGEYKDCSELLFLFIDGAVTFTARGSMEFSTQANPEKTTAACSQEVLEGRS
jgi:hypothetical protein